MKILLAYFIFILIPFNFFGQTIKIGENFEKYANNFELAGISTKDNSHSYKSIKPIPSQLYGRKVDKIIISTNISITLTNKTIPTFIAVMRGEY